MILHAVENGKNGKKRCARTPPGPINFYFEREERGERGRFDHFEQRGVKKLRDVFVFAFD